MKIQNKNLLLLLTLFIALPIQAKWFWYEPTPVIVYREPSVGEAIATGILGLGACVGLGIASIVKHEKNKKQLKEYVRTFQDMGYNLGQAKIYAKMAMEHPEGLKAVVDSIDKDKQTQSKMLLQNHTLQQSHSQKMQEMSHATQLKLMTYLVMMLSMVILAGLGYALYRRKK